MNWTPEQERQDAERLVADAETRGVGNLGDLANLARRITTRSINGGFDPRPLLERIRAAASAGGTTADAIEAACRAGIASGSRQRTPLRDDAPDRFQPLDLTPIMPRSGPLPAFPLDTLGERWAAWVASKAAHANVSTGWIGMGLLATGAALIGNARTLSPYPGDWIAPSILWVALVGEPGTGKTQALRPFLEMVAPIERKFRNDHALTLASHQAKAAMAEAAKERWKRECRKVPAGQPLPPPPPDAPPPPTRAGILIDDATIENTAAMAAVSPKGLFMAKDELSGWINNLERYSSNATGPWLEAINGGPRTIGRQKLATPLDIPHWSVSILGGIQPDIFHHSLVARGNDGMAQRFLVVWGDELPPPDEDPKPVPPWHRDFAPAAAQRLFDLALVKPEQDADQAPVRLYLTPEANEAFRAWRKAHFAERQAAEGLLGGFWAKLPGFALRIALVLEHLAWCAEPAAAEPREVGQAAQAGALAIVDGFLKPMARRVYGESGIAMDLIATTTLAKWIAKKRPTEVHARKMRDEAGCPAIFRAKDGRAAAEACAGLVAHGWLRFIGGRADGKAGRQQQRYQVNPALWAALDARAT